VASAQLGMSLRVDSRPTLATIDCPTLVVVGVEDTLTPPTDARLLAAGIPGSRLVEIENAGHLPNLEAPSSFNVAIAELLASLPR